MFDFPIKPTHNNIFIDIIDRDYTKKILDNEKVIHLISDDTFGPHNPLSGKHRGARPRWARVLSCGNDCYSGLKFGDLILCDELKWSRKIPLGRIGLDVIYFWRIKEDDVLIFDDTSEDKDFNSEWINRLENLDYRIGSF